MRTDTDKKTVVDATSINEGVRKILRTLAEDNEEMRDWDIEGAKVEYREAGEVSQPDDARTIYNVHVEVDGRDRAIAGQAMKNKAQTYGKPVIVDLSL